MDLVLKMSRQLFDVDIYRNLISIHIQFIGIKGNLGLGSRRTAVARKCKNINIMSNHEYYFQIEIFDKSVSYMLNVKM